MSKFTRRSTLKVLGSSSLAITGLSSIASAHPKNGSDGGTNTTTGRMRLFSEAAVDGAHEAVAQGGYAYVATYTGMAVVDWRDPRQPEEVARLEANDPAGGIMDVKVSGDLASLASNGGPGITLVDISDPHNPSEIGFYNVGHGIHNNFLTENHAYLTVNESGEVPFSKARCEIIDVRNPANPAKVGEYRLKDHFPEFAMAGVNPCHDIYVQDDLLYQAFWDAGTIIADVSDPSSPTTVSQFGAAPNADMPYPGEFPIERYLTLPGNAHYVQPSPDGQYVYQGAETFPGDIVDNPDNDDYGGIKVFDVSDYENPRQVTRISPPNLDVFRTSHNFDVTENRLHASWYNGGVQIIDVTDPANPAELGHYATDDTSFWTAVRERGFTIGSDIGGGLVFLHADSGEQRGPSFTGTGRPENPGLRRIDEK
ncbi:LVIVD repeat-containing protein [Halomicrococcus sp. NG-SE-24]|uniref:LVIVD repeat-containing protein n=1 Tax=Halomicrococcus sp. NG-SE-24 TaxID=3436928 RepID=UPI003D9733B8